MKIVDKRVKEVISYHSEITPEKQIMHVEEVKTKYMDYQNNEYSRMLKI